MNIFSILKNEIITVIKKLFPTVSNFDHVTVELSKDFNHGDFSTNAAMVLKNELKSNPTLIAGKIALELNDGPYIDQANVAGPGFINMKLQHQVWKNLIDEIIILDLVYGNSNIFEGKKISVEFVSANPTGPLHIGNAKGAIIGDAIARILTKCGCVVNKEYYVNDAGSQIETLVKSVLLRYREVLGETIVIEEGLYPGDYLIPVAEKLKDLYQDKLLTMESSKRFEIIKDLAIHEMLKSIKVDLINLDVKHDIFISEKKDLQDSGYVEKAINLLEKKGYIYKGVLEAPKGIAVEDWEAKEQTIFKASDFGDDVDRVVKKSDGNLTYFAGDFGLALYKLDQGFKEMVLLLGADHSGYVKRIEAMVYALSEGEANIDVKLTQMVHLFKGGVPFKMSKRAGSFILLKDVLNEVGKDILRFVILTKKSDTIIDFDFEKVKEQSKDNPVFYVQYAHTRASSVLRRSADLGIDLSKANLDLLKSIHEITLIKKVAQFPKIIESAAISKEPHKLTFYLIELANDFHAHWSKGSDVEDLRFIIEEDKELSCARCKLVKAIQITLKAGLATLGINAIQRM